MEAGGAGARKAPQSMRSGELRAALEGFAGASHQRYAIDRKIASGGHATVYLGRGLAPMGFERPVAIKVCHPHLLEGVRRPEALVDEARIAAKIRHPNVVSTLDVVVHDDTVMIVMEYVDGLTAAGLVRAAGRSDRPIPLPIALRVVCDALAGLHAAHELTDDAGKPVGVVHRDVSPQNVLVSTDGHAKLADFGVYKGDGRLAPSTQTGELKGKLGYVAPEVYRGEPVSRLADVYAVGVVLWELLAGRRLFDEATHAGMMHRALEGRVPALASIRDDVPAELDGIIARAMALDPADRYATAEDLARAIESLPISAASSRAVGEHVREAMVVLGERSTRDASGPSGIRPASELLTPNEYETPVQPTAGRPSTGKRVAILLALAVSIAIGVALVLLVPRNAPPAAANAQPAPVAAPTAPIATTVAIAAPSPSPDPVVSPPVPAAKVTPRGSVDRARASDRKASPASPGGTTASPAAPAPARAAGSANNRPLYDPEEL